MTLILEKSLKLYKSQYFDHKRWPERGYLFNMYVCKANNLKPVRQFQNPIPSQRFETIGIDLFDPLPET